MTGMSVEKDGKNLLFVLNTVNINQLQAVVTNNKILSNNFNYICSFKVFDNNMFIYTYEINFSDIMTGLFEENCINARFIYIKLAENLGYDENIVPENI